jgi:hypothetical protein
MRGQPAQARGVIRSGVRLPILLLIRISIAANNTQVAAARSGVRRLVAACSALVNRQTGRLAALLHGPRNTIDGSKGVAANPGGKPPVCGSLGLRKAATSRRTPERTGPVLMTAKCRGDWMYSIRSLCFLYSSPVLSAGQKFVSGAGPVVAFHKGYCWYCRTFCLKASRVRRPAL